MPKPETTKLPSLRERLTVIRDAQFNAGEKAGFSWAAQVAFDQRSDEPAPGDWNAACEHISRLLSELACKQ